MKKLVLLSLATIISFSTIAFKSSTNKNKYPPLETEQNIELSKYLGKWYEIARYKNNFQKGCLGTTAEYGKKGRYITVLNSCKKVDGKIKKGKALATVSNKETNATLKVSFVPILNYFGLFAGDYNILKIGPDYEYSLVGDKKRSVFWILSRTKVINENLYEELLDIAEDKGFKKELIIKSPVW